MENFVEILSSLNIGQLAVIIVALWVFYDRLDKKIDKVNTRIDKVEEKLDAKINNLYNLLFTCLNVSAVTAPEPKKRKRS